MSTLRVLCYLERWSNGGIEAFIYNILTSRPLSDEHVQVDVVAHKIEDSVFSEGLALAGVSFHELSGEIRNRDNERLFRKLIKENRYDVIHFNVFHGLSLKMIKIAKEEGVPVRIAHSHGAGLRRAPGKFIKTVLSNIGKLLWSKYPTERLACSREAGKFLFGNKRITVVKNGIDTKRFAFSPEKRAQAREELGYEGHTVLGHVGRFSEEKNQSFLIDVLADALKNRDDLRLLLIGDGPTLPQVKARAEHLGIADKVSFFGATSRTEDMLSAMDVFLFPSVSEGFGIAAIEAQCSGLPVIASEAVPKAALFCRGTYALPLSDAAAWVNKIAEVSSPQGDRAKGEASVKNAGYDVSETAREVFKLYTRGDCL